jgi:hypothetical protein
MFKGNYLNPVRDFLFSIEFTYEQNFLSIAFEICRRRYLKYSGEEEIQDHYCCGGNSTIYAVQEWTKSSAEALAFRTRAAIFKSSDQ